MILECLVVAGLLGIALACLYQLTAFVSLPMLVTLYVALTTAVLVVLEGFQMSIRIVFTVLILGTMICLPFVGGPELIDLVCFGVLCVSLRTIWRKREVKLPNPQQAE